MTQYFIKRNNKVNGPFTLDQIRSGIKSKKLVAADLASTSKDGPWQPLADFYQKKKVQTQATAKPKETADIEQATAADSFLPPLSDSYLKEETWFETELKAEIENDRKLKEKENKRKEEENKRKEEEKREEERLASMSGPRKALHHLGHTIGNALIKVAEKAMTFSVKVIAGLIAAVVISVVILGVLGLCLAMSDSGCTPKKPKPGIMFTPKGPRPIFNIDNE